MNYTNSVDLNLKLINAIVTPILLYGAETNWYNATNLKKIESFDRNCKRIAFGCNNNICNDVLLGEIGELSISIKIIMLKIRYYFNLKYDRRRLVTSVLEGMKKWRENKLINTITFIEKIKFILNEFEIDEEELKEMETEERNEKIKEKLLKKEEDEWRARIKKNEKLKYYKIIKYKLQKEEYLKSNNRKSTYLKIKLRSGVLELENEKERRNKERKKEDKNCKLCKMEIEDEIHFISTCNKLKEERDELLKNLQNEFNKKHEVETKYSKLKFFSLILGTNKNKKLDKWTRKAIKTLYKKRKLFLLNGN